MEASELVFVGVALNVVTSDGMVHPTDATIPQTSKALNGNCVNVTLDVRLSAMLNPLVAVPSFGQITVWDELICIDRCPIFPHRLLDKLDDAGRLSVL